MDSEASQGLRSQPRPLALLLSKAPDHGFISPHDSFLELLPCSGIHFVLDLVPKFGTTQEDCTSGWAVHNFNGPTRFVACPVSTV